MTQQDGAAACSAIGESLITKATLQNYTSDFTKSLAYLEYSKAVHHNQQYYIQSGVVARDQKANALSFMAAKSSNKKLPVLCTQSSQQNGPDAASTSTDQLAVVAGGNTYTGFRNKKSFRFQGIPYADKPARFEYSKLYSKTGQTIQATQYGANCAQGGDTSSSEDCLFLNIQTPFIPKDSGKSKLKPVLFSIHGGGFTGGNGGIGSGEDGGNLASREDIVSVEINYRLSTLGFLAIPGTPIKGNFGIGDQVTALQWVKKNIAKFGGDPNKITIMGESAGAGSVRALLGSPPVISNRLIAGAVAQSNLGGGVTLGMTGNYGTTYSSYYTIAQSYAVAGQQIFKAANCTQASLNDQITCLKGVSAQTLVSLATVARYVVQDGTYVNTEQLIVSTKNGSTAHVPVIFGNTANDGASIGSNYPTKPVTSEVDGIEQSLGITSQYAQAIIDSGLFPLYNTGNLTLDSFNVSQRVATDATFRCIDEATVYAGAKTGAFPVAYYYEMDRTYSGYDPSKLGQLSTGPISSAYPYGNPHEPYFRLHGSDLGFSYGNQYPLRDQSDLLASQLISGYFAQFAKNGNPNPSLEYLSVRGYTDQLNSVKQSGSWMNVAGAQGPVKALDYPSKTIGFLETEQCTFLNYTLSYYLNGGK